MRIMDRYLFWNFIAAYLICFTSLVGLYVVIDLFSNADEFLEVNPVTGEHPDTITFLRRVGQYYFIHSFEYFNRLSPIITMIAAMTTLASLHRNNEIVAMLAAGIPTKRALVPILGGALVVTSLGIVNREVVLPSQSEKLQRMHENIEGELEIVNVMHIDKDQVLIKAKTARLGEKSLRTVDVTLPISVVGQLQNIRSPHAYYEADPESGEKGWRLTKPNPPLQVVRASPRIKTLESGDLFLFSNVTFEEIIRRKNWMSYASTMDLVSLLVKEEAKNPLEARIAIHGRLMQPVLQMLLVLIGIPFVLQWEHKNIYRSIAISMLLCGMFFVVDAMAAYFASYQFVDPATAAWVPVFLFGPLAMSLFHRMGT